MTLLIHPLIKDCTAPPIHGIVACALHGHVSFTSSQVAASHGTLVAGWQPQLTHLSTPLQKSPSSQWACSVHWTEGHVSLASEHMSHSSVSPHGDPLDTQTHSLQLSNPLQNNPSSAQSASSRHSTSIHASISSEQELHTFVSGHGGVPGRQRPHSLQISDPLQKNPSSQSAGSLHWTTAQASLSSKHTLQVPMSGHGSPLASLFRYSVLRFSASPIVLARRSHQRPRACNHRSGPFAHYTLWRFETPKLKTPINGYFDPIRFLGPTMNVGSSRAHHRSPSQPRWRDTAGTSYSEPVATPLT